MKNELQFIDFLKHSLLQVMHSKPLEWFFSAHWIDLLDELVEEECNMAGAHPMKGRYDDYQNNIKSLRNLFKIIFANEIAKRRQLSLDLHTSTYTIPVKYYLDNPNRLKKQVKRWKRKPVKLKQLGLDFYGVGYSFRLVDTMELSPKELTERMQANEANRKYSDTSQKEDIIFKKKTLLMDLLDTDNCDNPLADI